MRLCLTLAALLCAACFDAAFAETKVIHEDHLLGEKTLVCVMPDLLEQVISLRENGRTMSQATQAVYGCLFTEGKTRVRVTEEKWHYTYQRKCQIVRFDFLDVPGMPPRYGLSAKVEKFDPGV